MVDDETLRARAAVLGGTYRTFYSTPLTIAEAHGCVITDADGRDHLDAYNNVPVIGHSNPQVRAAVDAQLARANSHTRYLDDTLLNYATRLVAQFPESLTTIVFACSGSEANDLALRLAAHGTGRDGIIVTAHAYHGTTAAVAAMSPSLSGRDGVGDHVEPIDPPAWDAPNFDEALAQSVRAAAGHLADRGHPFGTFILDSAVTSDGIFASRPLAETARTVRDLGGLWIADEVQAGFGRTGANWGFEKLGIVPDLVTLGKPMGNGLPISAVVGPRELFDSFGAEQRYFNTFAGTAVPIAAAEVVLTTLESGQLAGRAESGGELLESLLAEALAGSPIPATVRRTGLMVGVDFEVDSEEGPVSTEVASRRAKAMVELVYAERILVSSTGAKATILKVRPPLVITDEQLKQLADGIARALAVLAEQEKGEGAEVAGSAGATSDVGSASGPGAFGEDSDG